MAKKTDNRYTGLSGDYSAGLSSYPSSIMTTNENPSGKTIILRGVRVHNLKNIDLDIPRGRLVAVTGVSGSGKSSLVLDTLYAEGQRRYVESFSPYARQFLERMDRPDADHVENIPPAIAIEQKNPVKNRRSTVGTATELNDYLRLLFARIGEAYCPKCGARIKATSVSGVVEAAMELEDGTRFMVEFPLKLSAKLQLEEQIDRLREMGFVRIRYAGEVIDISGSEPPDIPPDAQVEVVVDRLVMKDNLRERLAEAVETCYRLGDGHCIVRPLESEPLKFTRNFRCASCGYTMPEVRPQLFSFNSALGACDNCSGYGATIAIDRQKVVPDPRLSLREGAVQLWTTDSTEECMQQLLDGAPRSGIPLDVPWEELTSEQQDMVFEGTKHFFGVMDYFEWLQKKKYKLHVRVLLSRYRRYVPCTACDGTRLCPAARSVYIQGKNIADISAMTIAEAREFFQHKLAPGDYHRKVAKTILEDIRQRLDYLYEIGLGYITLSRTTRTLSGGEMQRVNLATSLGSALVNALYILDEPSIGLHARDNQRLIKIIQRLRDLGNTVVVVEHEEQIIRVADYVIDLGPGAGRQGGEIVYAGDVAGLLESEKSVTGAYMRREASIDVPEKRRTGSGEKIVLKGCRHHNLKGIDVELPLGTFICITGVSGSGKSTLVQDTLYGAIKRQKPGGYGDVIGAHESLEGADLIDDVELVEQSPIGRTPRSNPVTYIKAYSYIRELFAETREARVRNLGPGTFSFNTSGGRCESCKGAGSIKVDMQFLPDVHVKCDKCDGKRFREDVLAIEYQGRSIHDVLEMTVTEAMHFFRPHKKLVHKLRFLYETGLGYIKLGQPATTLSGGEAQRLKLARYMSRAKKDRLLMIFDEPTVGLHFDDIRKLLACFQSLVDRGHTVLVVEHNLDVIKSADYVIDLGPEEGENGGEVVVAGTPEDVASCKRSHTGRFLKGYL